MDFQYLDASQQAVVSEPADVDLLCVAGPGSGKTRTLTARIVALVERDHLLPSRIRAATFTRAATQEMRDRLLSIDTSFEDVNISTIHRLCRDMIKETQGALPGSYREFQCYVEGGGGNTQKSPEIAIEMAVAKYLEHLKVEAPKSYEALVAVASQKEEDVKLTSVAAIAKALLAISGTGNPSEMFSNFIMYRKVAMHCERHIPDAKLPAFSFDYANHVAPWISQKMFVAVMNYYDDILKEWQLFDYTDQSIYAHLGLLFCQPSTREYLQSQWDVLAVDEFQDVDAVQFEVFRLLAAGKTKLNVVGDPDQAIYGFRGGDASFISDFKRFFPAASVVRLANNYRSHAEVVDAAYVAVAGLDQPYRAKGTAVPGGGGCVDIWDKNFKTLDVFLQTGTVGILAWTNKSLIELSKKLLSVGIISAIYTRWGNRLNISKPVYRRVRETLRALEMITGERPFDKEAFLKAALYFKGIGPRTIEKVDGITFNEVARHPKIVGYVREMKRLRNLPLSKKVYAVLTWAYFPKTDTEQLAISNLDAFDLTYDELLKVVGIKLYTIHRVKGLEFDTVFIETGDFSKKFVYENVDEARRLLFVALSRAKKNLFLIGSREQGGLIVGPVVEHINHINKETEMLTVDTEVSPPSAVDTESTEAVPPSLEMLSDEDFYRHEGLYTYPESPTETQTYEPYGVLADLQKRIHDLENYTGKKVVI